MNWDAIEHLGLWDHQAEAVESLHQYLHRYDRTQLLLTMGGGKTRIDLALMHQFTNEVMGSEPGANREKLVVVMIVPTLSLMRQVREEVEETLRVPHPVRVHALASDDGVVSGDIQLSEIGIPPTTSGKDLRKKIYDPAHDDKVEVVLSTFDCAAEAKKAIGRRRRAGVRVLVVVDEAHRSEAETFQAAREIDCDWMLSQTGTQGQEMADRTDLYGPVGYDLDQETAQERGIVREYKVAITPIRKSDLDLLTAEGSGSPYEGMNAKEAATLYSMELTLGDPDARVKAGLGFFRTIAESKRAHAALDGRRLADGRTARVWHLDGSMSADRRAAILAEASEIAEGEVNLIVNAKALTEGINFVVSNYSMIADERGPQPTIQAAGRSLRITDDPDRPGVVGKPLVVNDDDPENPYVEEWSLKNVHSTLEDFKYYHDKIDQHVSVPDSPAPPPEQRAFSNNILKSVYTAQNEAVMAVVRESLDAVRERLVPVCGRRYYGVRFNEHEGLWRATLRNPFKGPKPEAPRMGRYDPDAAGRMKEWEETPTYLVDDLFRYASDAASAYDLAIDDHGLDYDKNSGRNRRVTEIVPTEVLGIYPHKRGTFEAQLNVPVRGGGKKKRLSRATRSAGDSLRAQLAMAARYGILDEFLERVEKDIRKKRIAEAKERGEDLGHEFRNIRIRPPREEINFGLIRLSKLASDRFDGVEKCPAWGWWAFAEDRAGRTISLGHYEDEEVAGEVARRAREILQSETAEEHLAEGVVPIGERVGPMAHATMDMARLAASAPRPAR